MPTVDNIPATENELVKIFRTATGTQGNTKTVTSRLKRFYYGLESDEDLIDGQYTNGDLTMAYMEAVGEVTSQILKLTITDSRSGISSDDKITEKDDLVHRLRVMEQQRTKTEK